MSFGEPFIAVDWGTTNRRVLVIEDGALVETRRDDRGVTAVTDFATEVVAIRSSLGDRPMLLAGMVGANIGWRLAPYVPTPAGLDDLAANLLWMDARTAIVPGVASAAGERADVMRGEEVQFLGAVEAGLVPADGLLVQPGTHAKWGQVRNGRIAGFTTAMSGELFALLRRHGLLAAQLGAEVTAGHAFLAGVEEGKRRDLAASLFGIRAAGLLDRRSDAEAASYASGLLIGSEVAARLDGTPPDTVHVIADAALGDLYALAIRANGTRAHVVDSQAAFLAGIIALGARI